MANLVETQMKRMALLVVVWLVAAPVALAQPGEADSEEAPDGEVQEEGTTSDDSAGDAATDETPLSPDEHPLADAGAQERARLHFQSGASYYEAGSYDDALREWTRAYELSQRPELLYNLSLAHQGLNHLQEARDHLRRFLDEVEDVPNRANLETRIENLDRRIAAQAAAPDPDPGQDPDPDPDTTPPPTQASSGYISPGAIGGFVGAGVGVAMFAIFGGLTLGEDGRLQDEPSTWGPGAADGLRTFALMADIGLGLAVVGGVVGLVFLLVDTGPSESDVAVLPWFDQSGGGIAAGGRF